MELNRDQLIKALEICTGTEQDYYCTNIPCPYGDVGSCRELLLAHAFALIKELAEENERLKAQNETLEINNKDFKYRIYELSRDNEEWEHENKDLECDNDMLRERITEIKADTVRKMQERLNKHFCHDPAFLGVEQRLIMDVIDQIAKELLEE